MAKEPIFPILSPALRTKNAIEKSGRIVADIKALFPLAGSASSHPNNSFRCLINAEKFCYIYLINKVDEKSFCRNIYACYDQHVFFLM